MSTVKIWEQDTIIPTYKVYPPEKNPLFIEKRAYQGSTGKVYPLPVTEKISDTKEDVSYHAVYLENEYLKLMILPELGGRIQRALDKTNNYDFVYYNHVIKPALVGLAGPWISGGIEFNWPQHHRPSTYAPVNYLLKKNPDGSCTVHLSEIDKMYGTKGMASITLYPGKAYIEIKGRLYNNTDLPQTFLWWANPAVPVNDHTYSVFPPDVNAVMDHGKRAVSTFPIATGEYYKYDYSAGVDISRYKNVKVPTSYMAAHSDYDFIGNYDENREAGLLHVADHHVSPGKKQWTWGNGDFGRTWDKNLTDEDGPYIELMTGVFTDNQPDFSWLKPQEEKTFVQYFMPYKGVGRVGNATKNAALSLRKEGDKALLKVYATGVYENASIKVRLKDTVLYETETSLSPENCYEVSIPLPGKTAADLIAEPETKDPGLDGLPEGLTVTVSNGSVLLVSHKIEAPKLQPIPEPASVMKVPENIPTTEELYLSALHLEQYRHATYEPADYYLEGLRRDPTDLRLNNGYGLLLLRRGHAKEAIPYFQKAIDKQTFRNPNPYHGECYFNLGLTLTAEGEDEKAFDAFYKATWSAETQSPAFYWLAALSLRKGDLENALDFAEKSLVRNWHNMKVRTLKASILRLMGQDNSAFLTESLAIDPLYIGLLYEKALHEDSMENFHTVMREEAHNYLELALDYGKAGLYEDAVRILKASDDQNPLLFYYQAYFLEKNGQPEEALSAITQAEALSPDGCFPNKLEEIVILETAIRLAKTAPMAHLYLGNLLYDKKQYTEAIFHWETTVKEKDTISMAYRNLSIAYCNKEQDLAKAMTAMKNALALDPAYPRLWLEYDQLAAKMALPVEDRLKTMESHPKVTAGRDDLFLRYITLLNCTGRYEEALDALQTRKFHPWEGGEGKVSTQYHRALLSLALKALEEKKPDKALLLLTASLSYPDNLGEGKLPNVPDNEAWYYMGLAYEMKKDTEKAREAFEKAAEGSQLPAPVLYYNDQPSDYIYYQGLALLALGKEAAARKSFHQLILYGEKHIFDKAAYDFFAVSLPEIEVYQDDIQLRNDQYCNYLRALGALGLQDKEKAGLLLEEILKKQPDYLEAILLMKRL